jgi:hypothetical protein
MGKDTLGVLCIVIGVALIVIHAGVTLKAAFSPPPATEQNGIGTRGTAEAAAKLIEKWPNLGGGIFFIVLGAVLLGYLDGNFAFQGDVGGSTPSPSPTSS